MNNILARAQPKRAFGCVAGLAWVLSSPRPGNQSDEPIPIKRPIVPGHDALILEKAGIDHVLEVALGIEDTCSNI